MFRKSRTLLKNNIIEEMISNLGIDVCLYR